MQIQSAAPAQIQAAPPLLAGQKIGRLDRTLRRDVSLYSGGNIGQQDGYSSLGHAVAAARLITSGRENGAAAIFEVNNRFYAQLVTTGKSTSTQAAAPLTMWDHNERGYIFTNDAVKAIVDGTSYADRQVQSVGTPLV